MLYSELQCSPAIHQAVERMGFAEMTEIQEKTIPVMMAGHDVIAKAPTGTGKTCAFGIPVAEHILPENKYPQAVIMAPTRELAQQIAEELTQLTYFMPEVQVACVYGGANMEKQAKRLAEGCQIVVATPGRLMDHYKHHTIDISHVTQIVLDEADEMLNMGFTDSINAILAEVPENRNMLLFSATMPKEIANITKKYMKNPKEIVIGNKNEGNKNIRDIYYMVQARDKYLALKRIADFYPNIYGIVFCRTRKETQEIADKLIQDGYNADSLHGELSQAQRDYVMQKFRVKNIQLLVATDVAARGLDVDDLTHVINYGLPDEVESYTHRRGRTGRAGKTGISISICHVKEKGKIREIERIINKKFEKGEMPTGHAICEKQLFNLVDQIEKVKVNEEEIASLMPQIYRKLEWLDKEDIIKRVVSLEFNRMIDYYKDADEIQQVDERSSRSERGERRAHAAEEGYSRFFLNFGKADGLYPNQLIELVNKCVPGKVRIGKIDLRENFSFFEVEEGEAQRVMDSMNGFEVDGRRISVEPAQGKKEEGGRGGKRSYGGRRSDDGYKGKRGSKDSGRRGGDRSDRTFRKDERDSDRPWKRTAAARDARKKRRF